MLENQNGNKKALPHFRFTRWDGAAAALVVILALFLLFRPAPEEGTFCVLTWDGGEKVLSFAEPETLTLESRGITLTVTVSEDGVSVTEADCPDGICQKTGVIRHRGEIIVCVPANVIIRIPGETEEDFIAG